MAPTEDELDSDEDVELGSQALGETLPQMLAAVQSNDPNIQLDATMKFRKSVSSTSEVLLVADHQASLEGEEPPYRPRDRLWGCPSLCGVPV